MLIKCVCLLCCEEVTCNADGVTVRNGRLSGGKNTLGSKRKVNCTSGFKIAGPNETECKSDGEWSVKTFNCTGIYTHETWFCDWHIDSVNFFSFQWQLSWSQIQNSWNNPYLHFIYSTLLFWTGCSHVYLHIVEMKYHCCFFSYIKYIRIIRFRVFHSYLLSGKSHPDSV